MGLKKTYTFCFLFLSLLCFCFFKAYHYYKISEKEILTKTEKTSENTLKRIQKQIEKQSFFFHFCMEAKIPSKQKLEAQLKFSKTGEVTDVQILNTTILDFETLNCIKKQFKKIKLNLPIKKELEIIYPLVFK